MSTLQTANPPELKPTAPPHPGDDSLRWVHSGRVPSLDGLRALAVGLVLNAHAAASWKSFVFWPDWLLPISGSTGVDLFFVISGFLITLLLLRERARTGRISLAAFWVRRALRILPAFLTYLAVVALLAAMHIVQVTGKDWAYALTYTVNFHTGPPWIFGHLWSLSIEEHFYLIWPVLLMWLGPRRATVFLVAVLVLSPALRFAMWYRWGESALMNKTTPFRLDALAAGCLLAFACFSARGPDLLRLTRRWAWPGVLAALGLHVLSRLLWAGGGKTPFEAAFVRPLDAAGLSLLVLCSVAAPRSLLGLVLNLAPLQAIGILSYSLYLWQQPFLWPQGADLYWCCRAPQNLLFAVAAASASYYIVERPFLRWKHRAVRSDAV